MIIFYDGTCPLCNRAVRVILQADVNKKFYFAPLQGKTAKNKLQGVAIPIGDTLILYEDPKHILVEGRAVLRICWHLGGWYSLLGSLSFLPPFLFDWLYRIVARNRFRLFSKKITIEKTDRFLP